MAQKKQNEDKMNNSTESKSKPNVHEGHRDRVRQKIRVNGIDSLPDHEVLEYLLFMVTPRKDVNGLAHELIDKFGGFDRVLDASESDLLTVKGVTKTAALFLSSYTSIYNKYLQSKESKKAVINTLPELSKFFINRIGNSNVEVLLVACFDVHFKIKRVLDYTSNDVSKVMNSPKQILSDIVKTNCSFVAIAHNHPGGVLHPSHGDLQMTYNVYRQLQVLDIRFLDSLVITCSNAMSILSFARTRASTDKDASALEQVLATVSSPVLSLPNIPDRRMVADPCDEDCSQYDFDDVYEPNNGELTIDDDIENYSDCIYHADENEDDD